MKGTRKYHPERGNPITKERTWYVFTDKWIVAQKLRIPKIQFTDHKKFKNKEDQSNWGASEIFTRGYKILMGANIETMYGAETEEKSKIDYN